MRSSGRSLAVSVADQAASSLTNVLLLIAVAREATVSQFGTFSLAYSILAFALVLNRSAVGVPISVGVPRATPGEARLLIGRSLAITATLATAVATLSVLVVTFSGLEQTTFRLAATVATAIPIVLLQDLLRFICASNGHAFLALVSDTVWLAAAASALGVSLASNSGVSPTLQVLCWAFGALVALIVVAVRLRSGVAPILSGALRLLGENNRRTLGLEALTGAATPLAAAAMVVGFAGADVLAALRGALTVMGPISLLLASVPLAVNPFIGRRGLIQSRQTLRAVSASGSILLLVWGALFWWLPDRFGAAILGPTWVLASPLIPIVAVEYAFLLWWTLHVALLQVGDAVGRCPQDPGDVLARLPRRYRNDVPTLRHQRVCSDVERERGADRFCDGDHIGRSVDSRPNLGRRRGPDY